MEWSGRVLCQDKKTSFFFFFFFLFLLRTEPSLFLAHEAVVALAGETTTVFDPDEEEDFESLPLSLDFRSMRSFAVGVCVASNEGK